MTGELKGSDHLGNQYYENLSRLPGRQRFVVYAGWGKGYDPSQVPPEWHQWLHSISDRTPVERPVQPRPYQLQAQPMKLSQYGMLGNYSPPGSFARQQPKTHSNYNVWEKDKAKDEDDSGVQARV
jgi:NADH:ubiquinone oxidoreductase subunit